VLQLLYKYIHCMQIMWKHIQYKQFSKHAQIFSIAVMSNCKYILCLIQCYMISDDVLDIAYIHIFSAQSTIEACRLCAI